MATEPIFYSYEETYALTIGFLRAAYPGWPTHPLSFLGQQAHSLAQVVGSLQQAAKHAHDDTVPAYQVDYDGVIRSRCSSERLDEWAFTFGLPSNRGAGVYGRNAATVASGGTLGGTAVPGAVVPAGTQGVDSSGLVTVTTTAGATANGFGIWSAACKATSAGKAGNLPALTAITISAPPVGVNVSAALSGALSGGADEEDDLALLVRILARLRNPPRGGTAADIRAWCEEATDAQGQIYGLRAWPYPKRDGGGSTDVVITIAAGTGQGRDPGSTVATAVQAVVDAKKCAADTIRVLRPRFVSGQELKIVAKITPGPTQYAWDWGSGTTAILVVSGTGTSLVLDGGTVNSELKAKVDAGSKPRITVNCTGVALPAVPRVTAYANSTPMAGQHTLTLETALPASAIAGRYMYPGSSAVTPIATAILAYADSIGPSRQSGYADPLDVWPYAITIAGIARAILDATDDQGQRIVSDIGGVGAGTGITIAVGSGLPAANDYTTTDNSPGNAPQVGEITLIQVIG